MNWYGVDMAMRAPPSEPKGAIEPITTQRAYTLRLRGVDPQDTCWRDALWATHEAINKGANVFGDWLLTLRGGLSHELAEPPPPTKSTKRSNEQTAAIRKNRRILLSLSWLSVEDELGALGTARNFIVARGAGCKFGPPDSDEQRKEKVLSHLREVLANRKVGETAIDAWIADCADSLAARIRDDAVWVNRSAVFDRRAAELQGLSHGYASETILSFFGPADDYFALPDADAEDDSGGGGGSDGPEFRTLARQWTSTNFGTGEKSDTDEIVRSLRKLAGADLAKFAGVKKADLVAHMSKRLGGPSLDIDGLRVAIGWKTGRPSAGRLAVDNLPNRLTKAAIEAMQAKFTEEAGKKYSASALREVPAWMGRFRESVAHLCGMPFKIGKGRDHIGEYSVMLDHAARRVSIGHSWIKRAEAERRKFEEDAQRLNAIPTTVTAWLDQYTFERSGSSGATAAGGEYRIRRRAIEGWDEVVKRWQRRVCRTAADRIATAREAQADPEIEKFGDIQLFEAIAADSAVCVWRPDGAEGKSDAQILKNYVLGHDARFKQRRFKVPAYRHPDPLRHPVFGDFGNSRWSIEYAVHEAAKIAGKKRAASTTDAAWLKDARGLRMGLWNSSAVSEVVMRWSSKRLTKDLVLGQPVGDRPVRDVTRADRLGRAASGLKPNETPAAAGLFAMEDWNGRLQAPRAQLNALAAYIQKRHGAVAATKPGALNAIFRSDERARKMRGRIEWLVSFSAKLECRGPWYKYFHEQCDQSPFRKLVASGPRKGQTYESVNGWPHSIANDAREGHASLILSRLPNLRLLSVDLGHRYAAACAVWETLTRTAFIQEIAGRAIVAGGPSEHHLYCHTRHTDPTSGKERVTIYRRVGSDTLSDGKGHPAPWARLDRQFLIKLLGEEKPARAASSKLEHGINEMKLVDDLASGMSYDRTSEDDSRGRGVDELMGRAVRLATLGLKRHGRMGKIAYALNPECPGIPQTGGGLDSESVKNRKSEKYIEFLTKALADWHAIAADSEWDGSRARELWNVHIRPLPCGFEVGKPDKPDPTADGPTRQQKRKQDDEFRESRIKPIAEHLAKSNPSFTLTMFAAWKALWESADGLERTKDDFEHTLLRNADGAVFGSRTVPKNGKENASGWHTRLRLLTDWIMGRRLPGASSKAWSRQVGGLSLTRIATMRSLYQLHKAFAMRPTPEKAQGAPERGESNTGTAQGILDAMERMREQRVKQIASRIAASALGIGGHWKEVQRRDHQGKPLLGKDGRPRTKRVWVEGPNAKYPACHTVVIEDLRNYRPDELQTRRENKALMVWSAGKVRKYLEEACQLHGLHLREVRPDYTSRQCSRTGLPGMRCADVPVADLLTSRYWKKVVMSAKKRLEGKTADEGASLDRFILDLHAFWLKASQVDRTKQRTLRIPRSGADLFVAAGSAKALQADLNAAANIGLRALLDPDFIAKWWYVPCDSATGQPAKDKCAGAACLDPASNLITPAKAYTEKNSDGKKSKGGKEKTNAWRDVGDSGGWRIHSAYWNDVKQRVTDALMASNGFQI